MMKVSDMKVMLQKNSSALRDEWTAGLPTHKQAGKEEQYVIDTPVYSNNSLYRLVNNCKPNYDFEKPRVKMPLDGKPLWKHVPSCFGGKTCKLIDYPAYKPAVEPPAEGQPDLPDAGAESNLQRGFSQADVEFLLKKIDPNRGRAGGWIQIAAFLKFHCEGRNDADDAPPIFADAFTVFDEWSKPAANYKGTADCRKTWDSLNDDRVRFGTMVEYAKADYGGKNLLAVKTYMKQRFSRAVDSASNYTELQMTYMLRHHLPERLCDTKKASKKEKYYEQGTGGIWHLKDDNHISLMIVKHLLPELDRKGKALCKAAVNESDEEKQKRLKAQANACLAEKTKLETDAWQPAEEG